MAQTSHIKPVLNKIKELKKIAPGTWAEQIADKMGCSISAVREYARGIKGVRNGKTIEVLEHLIEIVETEKKRIKKLTA